MSKVEDATDMATLKTGTTTVGIICKDGVVLAADKRATAGHLIATKHIKKVLQISDSLALTTAGLVSDIQLLVKWIKSEINLFELRNHRKPSVKEVANLLALVVYNNIRKFSPIQGVTHFLLAGFDTEPRLYDIFPDGSVTDIKEFVASGSGMELAYGFLESNYSKNINVDQAKDLAVKAINSALNRDVGSGGGVDVIAITSKGFEQLLDKELDIRL